MRLEFSALTDEIARLYKRCSNAARSCMAIPRGMKPKQYRRQLWELGRLVVRTSRLPRADQVPEPRDPPPHRPPARRRGRTQAARARNLARAAEARRLARRARNDGVKDLRKEQRTFGQRMQQLEEQFGASAAELRRTLEIITQAHHGGREPPRRS